MALAKSVTAVAIAKGATASISTLTLIQGALKIMAWAKAKTAIVAGVVVLAVAGATTVAVNHYAPKRVETFNDIQKQLRQKPGAALSLEALEFLVKLKLQGRLPGLPKDEQAKMIMANFSQDSHGVWQLSKTNSETYPATRTLRGSKIKNDGFEYYYTVAKASATNGWQLQKAWRTDTNGQVMEEFSVF